MWVMIIFAVIFAAIVLLLLGMTAGTAKREKQTSERLKSIRAELPEVIQAEAFDIRRTHTFSALPWLNDLLQRLNVGPRLQLLLYQADLKWSAGKLVLVCVAFAVLGAYLVNWRTGALVLALAVGAAAGACPIFYVLHLRSRRFDRLRTQLPEALDLMVAAIRAGHSLHSAMGMVSKESPDPVRGEFRQCFDEQNFGLDLRTSLFNLIHRVPLHDIRIIAAAVVIQKDTGGNLTEILEKVSYLIREDFRLQRQVQVHTAQGRLTGIVLTALPIGLGFLMYLVSPDHVSMLWKHPWGVKMLYYSFVSTTIGGLIIRKIIRVQV